MTDLTSILDVHQRANQRVQENYQLEVCIRGRGHLVVSQIAIKKLYNQTFMLGWSTIYLLFPVLMCPSSMSWCYIVGAAY